MQKKIWSALNILHHLSVELENFSALTCYHIPVSHDKRRNAKHIKATRDEWYCDHERYDCSRHLHNLTAVVDQCQSEKLDRPSDEVQQSWIGDRTFVVADSKADDTRSDQVDGYIGAVVKKEILYVLPQILQKPSRHWKAYSKQCKWSWLLNTFTHTHTQRNDEIIKS